MITVIVFYPQIYGACGFSAVKQTLKDVKEMLRSVGREVVNNGNNTS
jgi:hypothetical protein